MLECTQHPVQDSIKSPIKAEEIRAARPSLAVLPGPDGLMARQFRAIPLGIIVRIFNLILWYENLPKDLAISRTIFIPKKSQASLSGEFRPISISPVFAKVLHKIGAKIEMDDQQRAFRAEMDGCRNNTVLLATSCGAGIINSSLLSLQLWTSQEPLTAWNTVPSCGQQKQLAFHLC